MLHAIATAGTGIALFFGGHHAPPASGTPMMQVREEADASSSMGQYWEDMHEGTSTRPGPRPEPPRFGQGTTSPEDRGLHLGEEMHASSTSMGTSTPVRNVFNFLRALFGNASTSAQVQAQLSASTTPPGFFHRLFDFFRS